MRNRRTPKTVVRISSSPRSDFMKQTLSAVLFALALLATAVPASAANKEHQQLMADIRMLQEQSQLLQNLLGQLNETIKAVNTRLDQQAETTRKAFADQKLVIDNLTNDARIIREKLDDNNVRVGSISQEVDAMRRSIESAMQPRTPTTEQPPATSDPSAPVPPPTTPTTGPTPIASPKQMWDAA